MGQAVQEPIPDKPPQINPQNSVLLSMLASFSLLTLKLTVGILGGSIGVLAEAANSFLDFIASSFTYVVLGHSRKPADEDHPYGHGKFENIASIFQAILILVTGSIIIYKALTELSDTHRVTEVSLSIGVMLISAIVSLWVGLTLRKAASKAHSLALRSDAEHFMADVYSNVAVLLGLLLLAVTGNHMIDAIIGMIAGSIIIKSSWDIFIAAFHDLTDRVLEAEFKNEIDQILAARKDHILDVHRLRSRRSGPYKIVDMHITLCRKLTFEQAHDFVDSIENEIESVVPYSNVIIHADPCDETCSNIRTCNISNFPYQEPTATAM